MAFGPGLNTKQSAHTSLFSPSSLLEDVSIWTTSPLGAVVRRIICVCVCVCMCFVSSQLCCPLRFQNSAQTHQWEGLLLFGNFSFFMTPSLGWVSVYNSFVSLFISCPTSFQKEWAAFLGAWCPPPVFISCFVEFAQHSNDLLMNLWGRKWSPHPIPPPS